MTKEQVIDAIKDILKNTLCISNIEEFSPSARLNQDLYLDSVLIMHLILHLEEALDFDIPDNAITKEDFSTVNSLAEFLIKSPKDTLSNQNPISSVNLLLDQNIEVEEEFEDIKVHCFVSCLCEIIKTDERVDHRPFYFGVWDAEVVIDKDCSVAYHSENLSHDFFRSWFEKLYNVSVTPWYDPTISKQANTNRLISLLRNKPVSRNIMVMLDMFRLPERENKFNQNPFPHYVLLEETPDPNTWFMRDPDFRWEGAQKKAQVLHAIASPHVHGGYYFDSQDIRPTTKKTIRDYFSQCIKPHENPMTEAVRQIINFHLDTTKEEPALTHLAKALNHLPVLAIRKYAYEHGFAYFWRELSLEDTEFESWCDIIEDLVSSYKLIQYRTIKLSKLELTKELTKDQQESLVNEIGEILDQQDEREFKIKARLQQVYQLWCQKNFSSNVPQNKSKKIQMQEEVIT
mgnify:CR=1 FL=1